MDEIRPYYAIIGPNPSPGLPAPALAIRCRHRNCPLPRDGALMHWQAGKPYINLLVLSRE